MRHVVEAAQAARVMVDNRVWRGSGEQTDPGDHITAKFRSHRGPLPTTSPHASRTTEPVAPSNVSSAKSPRVHKAPWSKGLALTAHNQQHICAIPCTVGITTLGCVTGVSAPNRLPVSLPSVAGSRGSLARHLLSLCSRQRRIPEARTPACYWGFGVPMTQRVGSA